MHAKTSGDRPLLSAVVVHWRNEAAVGDLVAAWPRDPCFELLVVDNSSSLRALPPPARLLDPGVNLGFAGGVNHGLAVARAPAILLLNPDLVPQPGAVAEVLAGLDLYPNAAGIVPALVGPGGASQCAWQLRPLPSPLALLGQTLLLPGVHGPRHEPPAGTLVAQPAGAALALRRSVLEQLGGLDAGFYPAWFEDVDLGRRLAHAGAQVRYHPASRWVHALGGTVAFLGYGPFLWIYYRNLCRYLRLHHGQGWVLAARASLVAGMLLRLLLVPLVRPRRAQSRGEAARGLLAVVAGALSGWRRPWHFAATYMQPGRPTDEA